MGVPIILHYVCLSQLSQEVLVMCDDYQLEVCVVLPFIDNTIRRKQDFVVSGQRI